jgi:hypothetical protein
VGHWGIHSARVRGLRKDKVDKLSWLKVADAGKRSIDLYGLLFRAP